MSANIPAEMPQTTTPTEALVEALRTKYIASDGEMAVRFNTAEEVLAALPPGWRLVGPDDDSVLAEACDKRGLPHDIAGLIRHIENNAAATIANWRLVAEVAKERMEAAEAKVGPDDVTVTVDGLAKWLKVAYGNVWPDRDWEDDARHILTALSADKEGQK